MDSVVCWKEDSSFQQIIQIVSGLEVINDAAGRSVQFDSDYNEILRTTTKHTSGCITYTQKLLPHQNKPFQKISDFLFLISLEAFEICRSLVTLFCSNIIICKYWFELYSLLIKGAFQLY